MIYAEETRPEADPFTPTTLDENTPGLALDLERLVWDPEYRDEMRSALRQAV